MNRPATRVSILVATALLLGATLVPSTILAQIQNDTPGMSVGVCARGGIEMNLLAGASGAPGGFSVWWMKESDFLANGGQWYPGGAPVQMEAVYTGTPTLHTMDGTLGSFLLSPSQAAEIEIGDIFDETGLTTNSPVELEPGVAYVFCVFANAGGGLGPSAISATLHASTRPSGDCIFTQGFWKNHPAAWPVMSLTLGTVTYSQAELLSILNTPAAGNGLLILAHQLIAAKLNVANGGIPTTVASAIATADGLIGGLVVPPVGGGYLAPSLVTATTQALDDYNNGLLGGGDCVTPAQTSTWGRIKSLYR